MNQNELHPSGRSKRKRVGRGPGSGHGTYSCRGLKGQKSRSGGGVNAFFEGGQTPLTKRLPYKRGFTNIYRVEYAVVNLDRLNVFPDGSTITADELIAKGIIKGNNKPVKILGDGELSLKLTVQANKFSKTAKDKIEAAGGQVEVLT